MQFNSIQEQVADSDIDAWMLIDIEGSDPYFQKYITKQTNAFSVAVITKERVGLFVHTLDADNVDNLKREGVNVISYSSGENVSEKIGQWIGEENIGTIGLNYSTLSDVSVDVLGHGMYESMVEKLTDEMADITRYSFVSAEPIIYALVAQRSESEIAKMRIAARRAHTIITRSLQMVRPGMTESELADLVRSVASDVAMSSSDGEVIDQEFAWGEELCPVVLTGDSFTKGGHAAASEEVIEKSSTVYIDFGVTLTFVDGSRWSSDLQRTAYVLPATGAEVPEEIQNRFDAIIESISAGIERIHPGMKGYEADNVVRGYLQDREFADYDHASGHPIGEDAHAPGVVFGANKDGRSTLEVQPSGVYTIEPRVPVPNGVSIEEMVVFYDDKPAETLCERQMKPIIIDGHLQD